MSCDTIAADQYPPKHPDEKLNYGVNFEQVCARLWEPWKDYAISTRIRVYVPGNESGFELEATTGGRTAGKMPRIPSVVAQTVQDGSVTWTVRALSSSSLYRTIVGTPTWTAETGVTLTGSAIVDQIASADIAGGTDANDYTIKCSAILSDGNIVTKTVILPVRIPVRMCNA